MGDVPRPQEDAEKWRRALVKKIRQVEELLARRGRGEALNERQLEKVARESSLRSALAAAEEEGAGQQAARTVPGNLTPTDINLVLTSATRTVVFTNLSSLGVRC